MDIHDSTPGDSEIVYFLGAKDIDPKTCRIIALMSEEVIHQCSRTQIYNVLRELAHRIVQSFPQIHGRSFLLLLHEHTCSSAIIRAAIPNNTNLASALQKQLVRSFSKAWNVALHNPQTPPANANPPVLETLFAQITAMDVRDVPGWLGPAVAALPKTTGAKEFCAALGLRPWPCPKDFNLDQNLVVPPKRQPKKKHRRRQAPPMPKYAAEAWEDLTSCITNAEFAEQAATLFPERTADCDLAQAVFSVIVSDTSAPPPPPNDDPVEIIFSGIRDGQRWVEIAETLGPGWLVLAAGGEEGLSLWSCENCSKVELDRAMEWVQTARPDLVAWSRTWGPMVMRAVMGRFGDADADGEGGGQGEGQGQEAIDSEGKGWKGRMVELCLRLPRRGGNQVVMG